MASDVGIDALNIKDAVTGLPVPVAGDFVDDGSGTPKWLQQLILAFGALGGAKVPIADADGFRMPVDSPSLAAISAALLAPAPFVRLDPVVKVDVPQTVTQVAGARSGRTKLFMRHAGDLSGAWTLAQRVWIGWDEIPTPGEALYVDPGEPFEEFVSPSSVFHAVLDPSASSGATQPLIVVQIGSD